MLVEEMLAQARCIDTDIAGRKIEQRMAVEEFSRLDRLEAALAKARAHVHWPTATTPAGGR